MPQAETQLAPVREIPTRPTVTTYRRPERRDLARRFALVQRVQREFDEMPGTCLTLGQATRLFGIAPDICHRILMELVTDGRLTRTADSRYRIAT
jgi:DNA-binding IclR family transcriptional regulator